MNSGSIPFVPSFTLSPPPPPHQSSSSMPIFYYGIVVVGAASIILALYNFMILRWCTNHRRHMSPHQTTNIPIPNTHFFENQNSQLFISKSVKYKKDQGMSQEQGLECDCPICISSFEDGEDVTQLPRCNHSFHTSCIDMWLLSHFDCPVCRARLRVPILRPDDFADQSENSREVLLLGSIAV